MQFCTQCGQKIEQEGECPNCSSGNSGHVGKNQRKGGINKTLIGVLMVAILVVGGFVILYQSPAEKANELFVEASSLVQSIPELQNESFLNAFNSANEAQTAVDTILSEYSETDLAVNIVKGEAKIGPYSSKELEEVISQLGSKAEAETSPLAAAHYIALNSEGNSYEKYTELLFIAQDYAELGDYEKANGILTYTEEMSRYLEDELGKEGILAETAIGYAYIKQFDRALQVVEKIQDEKLPTFTLVALTFIASELAENGQMDKAVEVLSEAYELHSEEEWFRLWASGHLAAAYAKVGEKGRALEMLGQTIEKVESDGINRNIAYGYLRAGEYDKALQTIVDIDGEGHQLYVILKLLREIEDNNMDKISDILPQALRVAETVSSNIGIRSIIIAEIAGSYAKIGEKDKAVELLTNSLELVKDENHPHPYFKAQALAFIAGSFAEAGQEDKALEIAYLTLQEIQKITDDISQARGLSKLGYEMEERDLKTNKEMQVLLHSLISNYH